MLNMRGNRRNFAEADRLPVLARGRSIKDSVSDMKLEQKAEVLCFRYVKNGNFSLMFLHQILCNSW
jgi:hypothetical protein